VVYTPENEHFGLVPIEAMYSRRPVIAVSSGGPLETVVDGSTGFLVAPEPEAFAGAMARVALWSPATVREWGDRAHEHARANFSLEAFSAKLEGMLFSVTGAEEENEDEEHREQQPRATKAAKTKKPARTIKTSKPAPTTAAGPRQRKRSLSRPRRRSGTEAK
jgi:hypothetical protein